jgi:hypothetical protein
MGAPQLATERGEFFFRSRDKQDIVASCGKFAGKGFSDTAGPAGY